MLVCSCARVLVCSCARVLGARVLGARVLGARVSDLARLRLKMVHFEHSLSLCVPLEGF